MNVPRFNPRQPLTADALNKLGDAIRAYRVTSFVGGRVEQNTGGTSLILTAQTGGGGAVDANSLWDVTLSPKPNYDGEYLINIKNLGLVFNSIHYSDAVTPVNNIDDVTWSGSFDVVWAQLNWGENGFVVSVECGSNPDADFGTGEVQFEQAGENWPPAQTYARLVLATITPGEAGPPGQPPSPPVVKKLINSNLRATTSFAFDQTNGAYFDSVIIAAHASVDPTERFRWAAGNNVKGWDYLLGKGYSSFSQDSVDNVRAMEVAVGDPTKNDASGLTLIVGDANTGTDLFQLYSGEGAEQKKIFAKWTEALEVCLQLDTAKARIEINNEGNPSLSLTRTDYDVGATLNSMGKPENSVSQKSPTLSLYSNTDYAYLTVLGTTGSAQLRIADAEQTIQSRFDADKWSLTGIGPAEQEVYIKWANDVEVKLLDGNTGARLSIINDYPQLLLAQNWDNSNTDAIISAHLYDTIPQWPHQGPVVSVYHTGETGSAHLAAAGAPVLILDQPDVQSIMWVHADYIQRQVGETTSYALFAPDGAGTGDILYYNADTEQWQNAGITPAEGDMLMFYNNAWVRLEAGEDGKVLTMLNGLPHWMDNEGGGGLPEGGIPGDVLRMGANGPYWENTSICY